MSRPYININSASYSVSTNIVSLDLTALRLRGATAVTLSGFTSDVVIPLTDGYNIGTFTFSENLDTSTSSGSATYVPATVAFTIGGTTSVVNDNFKLTLGSTSVLTTAGLTSSAGATNSANFALQIKNAMSLADGFTSSLSGSTITITAPWGSYHNGMDAVIQMFNGVASTATASFVNGSPTYSEFSGGESTYSIDISYPSYFGITSSLDLTTTVGTASIGSIG